MNKTQGYYFGQYDVLTEDYSGPDFSRRCFIFSGQGFAFPGMFKEQYLGFKIISEKFEQADALAKKLKLQKISDYILKPENLKEETLPIVRNLALFTLEVALCELLVAKKIIPKVVMGHSFGEYTALTAAGAVSFEEMFDILYHRDYFCPPVNFLGWMVAVNADQEQTKKILEGAEFYVSNLNSSEQTVVSAAADKIDKIKQILEAKRIKHKILSNVPQPYHAPYLNDVKDKIEEYLKGKKLNFKKPQIPLFSSVAQKLIDANNFNEEEMRSILINQIISPVNFISQISSVYGLGCFNFVEFGVERKLAGFINNILAGKEMKADSALNLLAGQKKDTSIILSPQSSKLFALISKTIGKITGYEIEKISFEDRYQEDLGIDSIKKAEILLTVLKKSNISPGEDFSTADFGSIKDTVDYLADAGRAKTRGQKALVKKEARFERYIYSWSAKPLTEYPFVPVKRVESLMVRLEDIYNDGKNALEKIRVFLEKTDNIGERRNIIIFSSGLEFKFNVISPDEFQNDVVSKITPFIKFFRELVRTVKQDNFNLALASGGLAHPYIDGYAAFLKSVKKELPGLFFKHIHFDANRDSKDIQDLVEREMREPGGKDVLYKNGQRFTAELKRAEEKKIAQASLNKQSVIAAIGGARGITFSLIENISRQYQPVIYLAGRSAKANRVVKKNIEKLKKHNAEIYYESLDAADISALEGLFIKIKKKHGKIDLVVNGAGVVAINFLKNKTDEEIGSEFKNKVWPAFNILSLALKYRLGRIINFSSIISNYGSAGQSIYGGANALISGLTAAYNSVQSNDSPGLTIHWPPWDSVGMTGEQGISQKLKEYGTSLLKPGRANELFLFDAVYSEAEPVYYLDEDDLSFYGFFLNNLQECSVLIGRAINPFSLAAASPVFEKTFDLTKDAYLKDHQIKGVSYVPAAVGISMFLCLAKMNYGEFPVLENIVIHNPIIIKDQPLTCSLLAEKKGDVFNLSIKSNVLHFSCRAGGGPEKKAERRVLPPAVKEVLAESIYSDYYSADSLYQGPIFWCIDRVFLDKEDNIFIRVDNSALLPVLNCGIYDKLIQWLDVSFQALGAIGLKNNRKLIPTKVSRLETLFHNKISNYLYVIPSVAEIGAKTTSGDVVVINESGEVILEMKGVELESINEYAESRLEIVKYKEK